MAEPSVEELKNDYLRMRKIEDLFHSPQQVQEVKPINPLYDNKSPFFDYINNPIKTEEWGDDLIIWPIDGYGDQNVIRSMMRNERPDILWFMTDPRFYGWLWEIENEIRITIKVYFVII